MRTVFASQGGFVSNTAVVDPNTLKNPATVAPPAPAAHAAEAEGSGLGGEIGKLAAALNTVGWNHGQVPRDERMPVDEHQLEQSYYANSEEAKAKLGGQFGKLAAALETVGWNHGQIPPGEKIPPQEKL
ncbi:MAG: hypothetical protein WCO00_16720 [Rhodospirillaceae bacterium]